MTQQVATWFKTPLSDELSLTPAVLTAIAAVVIAATVALMVVLNPAPATTHVVAVQQFRPVRSKVSGGRSAKPRPTTSVSAKSKGKNTAKPPASSNGVPKPARSASPTPGATATPSQTKAPDSAAAVTVAKAFVLAMGTFNYKNPTATQKAVESYATPSFKTKLVAMYQAYAALTKAEIQDGTTTSFTVTSASVRSNSGTTAVVVVTGTTSATAETTPGNPATEQSSGGSNSSTDTVTLSLVSGRWWVSNLSASGSGSSGAG